MKPQLQYLLRSIPFVILNIYIYIYIILHADHAKCALIHVLWKKTSGYRSISVDPQYLPLYKLNEVERGAVSRVARLGGISGPNLATLAVSQSPEAPLVPPLHLCLIKLWAAALQCPMTDDPQNQCAHDDGKKNEIYLEGFNPFKVCIALHCIALLCWLRWVVIFFFFFLDIVWCLCLPDPEKWCICIVF